MFYVTNKEGGGVQGMRPHGRHDDKTKEAEENGHL